MDDFFQEGSLLVHASRFHEMNAVNSINLDNLTNGFNILKEYMLCPAKLLPNNQVKPFVDLGILKKSLQIRNAWEIGENDLDGVVIKPDDFPIIPDQILDAPVLKLLQKKKTR